MKHTSGPWSEKSIGAVYRRFNGKGINQLMVEIKGGKGDEDECRANARLIAAAPELLEALESALKTAEFQKDPFRSWHEEARRAIAKATTK